MVCYSLPCISKAILARSPLSNFRLLFFYPLTILHWSSKLRLSRAAEIPTLSGLPTIALSSLAAILMDLRASVANKRLTAWLSLLDATLTRNRGGPPPSTFRRLGRTSPGPIAAKRHWCNNPQRRENSSPSGETTPLPPVSKDSERTSGTVRHRSRSQTSIRSGLQVVPRFSVLTLDRSRVARSTASGKDAGKCRVGKAGSVRLG
jgi:hypothetical protein